MNRASVRKQALRLYSATTVKDLYFGQVWYKWAKEDCQAIASELDKPLDLVIKIVAACSVQQGWKGCLTKTRRYLTNPCIAEIGDLPSIKSNIMRIRDGLPLRGQKVTDFVKAISGNDSVVVVDRWILRAFGAKRADVGGTYQLLASGIADAANKLDIPPRTLQATLWVQARGKP